MDATTSSRLDATVAPPIDAPAGRQAQIERVRLRFAWTTAGANLAGVVLVFVLLTWVLPGPPIRHQDTAQLLSVIGLVVAAAMEFPAVWIVSTRRWKAALGWAAAGREPTRRERDLTLRFPLSQQWIAAVAWLTAAVLFAALTAPFSAELSGNVAVTIVLGGLVTCALGYLLGERLIRPITALALASEVPARPQLPGVAARALLTWTLGTGVVLLGLVLIGIGGLHEPRFTSARLSIAIVVLSLIGIAVGLLTMLGLGRSLADRIESLRHAVARVEEGELATEVTVDDGSEVGLLQAGFNQMLAGLRERERLRDLFGRQVGEDVVRHALDHGVKLGGEARDAAVLFVDLQGSTALTHSHDPAEVVDLLNAFFAIVVEVVASHQGWVNKFEGDAALCIFGAPLEDPEAASRALGAARQLRNRLAAELQPIRAGIGVSAGRVVAGNVGAAKRFEYTVIGDPVNEAARLSELAKSRPERVLASGAALIAATPAEAKRWRGGELVTLRGRATATTLLTPR